MTVLLRQTCDTKVMSVCEIPTLGCQDFCVSASLWLLCAIVHFDAQLNGTMCA